MKAIVFDNGLKLDNNYQKPVPKEGEALIKVMVAGICNTDYKSQKDIWDIPEFWDTNSSELLKVLTVQSRKNLLGPAKELSQKSATDATHRIANGVLKRITDIALTDIL